MFRSSNEKTKNICCAENVQEGASESEYVQNNV